MVSNNIYKRYIVFCYDLPFFSKRYIVFCYDLPFFSQRYIVFCYDLPFSSQIENALLNSVEERVIN